MSRNRIAVTAVAVQLGIMFIGAILPTPLYPLYREAFGFSGVTLTLIYATYVLGNLAALLFFGRLADQIGRRSASVPAVAVGMLPRIGVPPGIRLQFVSPAVTGFATFSLIGFYAALIPSLLGASLHQSAPLVAGAVVGELFLIAAVAILASGALASQTATLTALLLLPPSVWILVSAEVAHSLALLLFAAAVGGLAGGLGYRGSLEVINRIAPGDRRSEVVSAYMIALFAGNSVPVIGIGFLSAATTALTAHVVFAAVLTVLAGIAMLTGIKYAPHK